MKDSSYAQINVPMEQGNLYLGVCREMAHERSHGRHKLQMSWALARYMQFLALCRAQQRIYPMTYDIEYARRVHATQPVDFHARGRLDPTWPMGTLEDVRVLWAEAHHGQRYDAPPTKADLRKARKVAPEWAALHRSMKAQRAFARKVERVFSGVELTESIWVGLGATLVVGPFDSLTPTRTQATATDYYSRFFNLFVVKKGEHFVPSILIDFVWHTHMMMGHDYWKDCERLAGHCVDHDDGLGHSPHARSLYLATRATFFELYGIPMALAFVWSGAQCTLVAPSTLDTSGACSSAGGCASVCISVTCGSGGGDSGGGSSCGSGGGDSGGGSSCGSGGSSCGGGGSSCGGGGSSCGGGGGGGD